MEMMMEKRVRSPNYPALSLKEAIDRIGTLYRNQHTHAAPREVVAKAIGYNSLNGASASAISALHKYGLLDRSGEDIKISERAMRILHPHSPSEKTEAIREAAREPALFAELAEKFPGRFPSEEVLRNYLLRNGFAPSAVNGVILAYRETSDFVEHLGGGYDSGVSTTQAPQEALMLQAPPAAQSVYPQPVISFKEQGNETVVLSYVFGNRAVVKIVTEGDISDIEALDMIEIQLPIKRQELKMRAANKNVSNRLATVDETAPD
jgi:hypothetical protein